MPKIFISYRRDDSAGHAGRIHDRLLEHYGADNLFMDVDALGPGIDFVEAVREAVIGCDQLIAVIGREWLEITGAGGGRRLDEPQDLVRLEIATAFDRGIPVIPVLVQGVRPPRADDLPDVLKRLANLNALQVSDIRFHSDLSRLIEALGYISAEQARALALHAVRESPGLYGRRYRDVPMAFEVADSHEAEDHYLVTLSFRPQGRSGGNPGLEQVTVGKEGTVVSRQVLSLPQGAGTLRRPVVLSGIGVLAAVVVVAAVGAVWAAGSAGGGDDVSPPVVTGLSASTPGAATPSPALLSTDVLLVGPTLATTATLTPVPALAPVPDGARSPTLPLAPENLPDSKPLPGPANIPVPTQPPTSAETPATTPSPIRAPLKVILEPAQVTLDAGSTITLSLKAFDLSENQVGDPLISWELLQGVGTIRDDGTFTAGTKAGEFPGAIHVAVAKGTATGSTTVDVVIEPGALDHIEVSPSSAVLRKGETLQLTAAAYDQYRNVITGLELFWEADGALTVDQNGRATVGQRVAAAPPGGLVAWWPGNGDTRDVIGGNHGVFNGGPSFSRGIVGEAFSLDGVDDYVQVGPGDRLNLRGDATVHLWARRTVFGNNGVMVVKGAGVIDGVDVPTVFVLRFGSRDRIGEPGDYLLAGFERDNGSDVFLIGPEVSDGGFHHYAYVRKGSTHTLYLDGVAAVTDIFIGTPGDTAGIPLVIGSGPSLPRLRLMFGGIIDEVQIFNRGLSDTEIEDIYLSGKASGSYEVTVRASYKGSQRSATIPVELAD